MSSALLVCHPASASASVRAVRVRVRRSGEALFAFYAIEGDMQRLRLPAPSAPRFAEGLWRHTCCELFFARDGEAAYQEFNFSPSGEWAAYAFSRYREGVARTDEALNPRIEARMFPDRFELEATVNAGGRRLRVGPAAVIEDDNGTLSYWALRHPVAKPDFHHPDALALELS